MKQLIIGTYDRETDIYVFVADNKYITQIPKPLNIYTKEILNDKLQSLYYYTSILTEEQLKVKLLNEYNEYDTIWYIDNSYVEIIK